MNSTREFYNIILSYRVILLIKKFLKTKKFILIFIKNSATGTRTRVSWVKAKYHNHLDYCGFQSYYYQFLLNYLYNVVKSYEWSWTTISLRKLWKMYIHYFFNTKLIIRIGYLLTILDDYLFSQVLSLPIESLIIIEYNE